MKVSFLDAEDYFRRAVMEMVLVTRGKGDAAISVSVCAFDTKEEAERFCGMVGRLTRYKDTDEWGWIVTRIVKPYEEYDVNAVFDFEDLIFLDNRAIQKTLREVDDSLLAKALKGVSTEVADKIFENMSKRAAKMLKEDMECMGQIPIADIKAAQKEIINVVQKLADTGEIVVVDRDSDIIC
jgi:hypothetical protein